MEKTIGISRYNSKNGKKGIERKGFKVKKGSRPRTRLARRLTKEEKKLSIQLERWMHETLPNTRAECNYGYRPCPYVRCRYNLFLEVKPNGAISGNWKCEPTDVKKSCALDIAEEGSHTLDQVGEYLNLTRERVRQLERDALIKLRSNGLSIKDFMDVIGNGSSQLFAYMDYIKYGNVPLN
jgi:Sigma-70, region 4